MGLGTCWGACPDMDEIQIFHDVLFVISSCCVLFYGRLVSGNVM